MVSVSSDIADDSAMDVGVTVAFDFTGQPPFIVDYTEQRNNGRIHSRQQIVQSMHGDMVLLPEQEGTYTYVSRTNGLTDGRHSKR